MSSVIDPRIGLQLLELSHVWGLGTPSYPGQEDVKAVRSMKHAQHSVPIWRTSTSLHTGTYILAPIHLIQRDADLATTSPDRFFGNGVALDVPKGSYETIAVQDLKKAGAIRESDIVVINTGWHHKYSDSLGYYGGAPGLTEDAVQWLVEKRCRMVLVDTPFTDRPLTTSMGPHQGGPQTKHLTSEHEKAAGLGPKREHDKRDIVGEILLGAGIPLTIQAGDDLGETPGKQVTSVATPWKFEYGDVCTVRFVVMVDSNGTRRIGFGKV